LPIGQVSQAGMGRQVNPETGIQTGDGRTNRRYGGLDKAVTVRKATPPLFRTRPQTHGTGQLVGWRLQLCLPTDGG